MRVIGPCRLALPCLWASLASCNPGPALAAGGTHCDPDLHPPATNPLGYRLRGERCEGVYIQDVGATPLKLVSFTESYESFDPTVDVPIILEWVSAGDLAVHLRAQSVRAHLYYRMDSQRAAGQASFTWASDLLATLRLGRGELGVLAWTNQRIGDANQNVLQPLRLLQKAARTTGTYHMVVVPGVQVDEIFVSMAPLKPNGQPGAFQLDKQPVGLGYYPAGRAVPIPVPVPSAAGIYRIDLGAPRTGGGSAAMTVYFSRPRP
jgi:hypothetical protein